MTADILVPLALAGGALYPVAREALRKPMGAQARRSAPGEFIELSGGQTHYYWSGPSRGPVAVCIHGLTTPSFVWRGLTQHLTDMGYRVLVYDLFGRGYSDRPGGDQSPAFFVSQLHELLRKLEQNEELTLFGYSMGGVIAAAYGAKYAHQLRRIVLIAPAGMEISLGRIAGFARDWPLLGDWAYHVGYPQQLRRGILAEASVPKSIDGLAEMQLQELAYKGHLPAIISSIRHSLRKPIPAIHKQLAGSGVPVSAIWGRDDQVIPISSLGVMAQWNRQAQQDVIEGAGHGLIYTHTDQVAEAIRDVTGLRA